MVKRASLKGRGKELLFKEAAKSVFKEDIKEEEILEEKEIEKEVKKESRGEDKLKLDKEIAETDEKIVKSFEEEHPLLTKDPSIKTSVSLSLEETEFLYNLGLKAKSTGGDKIPKNMIIRGFVKAFMDVKLNVDGLKKDDDKILFERVRGFIKK